ncbi:MAG: sulfonate transport system permease protein [Pseudonocardiales bacterium]|nr:sulfonate transport system permease protein [Pseudonocardiales bacterium]
MPPDLTEVGTAHREPPRPDPVDDSAAALAGLDALDTPTVQRTAWWRRALAAWLPPLVALVLFLAIWQGLWAAAFWPEF